MRMSTQTLYEAGTSSLGSQQTDLFRIQQQMATGRRVLTPADDPVSSSAILNARQALHFNAQHSENQTAAGNALGLVENTLGAAGDAIQDARQLILSANNGALTDADRRTVATQLENLLSQLAGIANTRDGAGRYMFGGFKDELPPFALNATGGVYTGDEGERRVEVAPQRSMEVTTSGAATFMRIPNGNGVFSARAGAANAGSGVIDPGQVVNPAALTGHQYRIQFTGASTYDLLDVTAGTTVSSANAFTPGTAIAVGGMQTTITGQPATGDTFDLAPSVHQDVFTTLRSIITALNTPTSGAAGTTPVTNQINAAVMDLDRAADNILTTRTQVGSRMAELDRLQAVNSASGIEHQRRLSELEDLDYAAAASDLTRKQTMLQANQETFARLAKLSLFNFLA